MAKKKDIGLAVVIFAAALVLSRRAVAVGVEGEGAGITLELLNAEGNPIPRNSPFDVIEGQSYSLRATVTNQSTRAGQPAAATLQVTAESLVAGITLSPAVISQAFGAGEARSFDYPFTVPMGTAGNYGLVIVQVLAPDGTLLASKTDNVIVRAIVISGGIGAGNIYYEGLAAWEALVSGRQVPFGVEVSLAPRWLNFSQIPIVGHVTLTLINPAGATNNLTAIQNQDREAVPGDGWNVQFAPFIVGLEGTYTLTAQLYREGVLLATVNFTISSFAEIRYAASVGPITWP